MKKKIPYILLVLALIVAAAIVIKGINDKKDRKEEYSGYAESIAEKGQTDADTEKIYEYYQTDPKTGLAVIYTFRVDAEKDGVRSGRITIDGAGKSIDILCAVKTEDSVTSFLFASYLDGSESAGDFSSGDVLVKLHTTDKDTVAEFAELDKIFPGEELVRNF